MIKSVPFKRNSYEKVHSFLQLCSDVDLKSVSKEVFTKIDFFFFMIQK